MILQASQWAGLMNKEAAWWHYLNPAHVIGAISGGLARGAISLAPNVAGGVGRAASGAMGGVGRFVSKHPTLSKAVAIPALGAGVAGTLGGMELASGISGARQGLKALRAPQMPLPQIWR